MASLKKRGPVYYIQFYVGTKQRRISTETESYQLAKEKLRQFESAEARGEGSALPTKTPIEDVLTAYVAHTRFPSRIPDSITLSGDRTRRRSGPDLCLPSR